MRKINNYVKLTFNQKAWHYSPSVFFLGLLLFLCYLVVSSVLEGEPLKQGINQLIIIGAGLFIAFVLIAIVQKKRLKYKALDFKIAKGLFDGAVKEVTKELQWDITIKNKGFIQMHRSWGGASSWGEMITVIHEKDRVLVNSICDPEGVFVSLFSYGRNKRNIKAIEKKLSQLNVG